MCGVSKKTKIFGIHCKCKCRINVVTPLYKIVYLMWRFNIHEITFIRHFGCCSKCLLNIPLLALASMLIKHYLDPINSKTFISNSKTFISNFFTSNTRFCIMVWQRLFYIYIYSVVQNHNNLKSSNFQPKTTIIHILIKSELRTVVVFDQSTNY